MKNQTTTLLQLIIAIAILLCPAKVWAAVDGDVNGDDVCNSADVTALYNWILNNDSTALVNGDQNNDHVINTADITYVYNIILGFSNPVDNEEELFAQCYATLRSDKQISGLDYYYSSFLRSMWVMNNLTTDEAYCVWGDEGIKELNQNTWNSSLPQARGLFMRLCDNIDACNSYLASTAHHDAAHNAEIRILRALYYYYLMDFFGNVPLNTDATTQTLLATQTQRTNIFSFILTEVKECENNLLDPLTNDYGRIDKAAAWMLMARINLNKEVYSPSITRDEKKLALTMARNYAKKIIDSNYKLNENNINSATSFQALFMSDNDATDARKEIILPIIYSSDDTGEWQWYGITALIAANFNYSYANINPNGLQNATWAGFIARPQFALKFNLSSEGEGQPAANVATMAGDNRALFMFNNLPDGPMSEDIWFSNGVSYQKYTNMTSTGNNPNTTFASTDYPLMRVSEAYLSYAEADSRLNNGSCTSEGLAAVNLLRTRSGASAMRGMTTAELIHEWSREFGYEGRRRIDLVRYNMFGHNYGTEEDNYTWDWKGGAQEGRLFDASKNIFAIPSYVMEKNSSMTQNPGYDIQYPTYMLFGTVYSGPDGYTSGAKLTWDGINSTEHIINPVYQVYVSPTSSFSSSAKIGTTEELHISLSLNDIKKYVNMWGTNKLYFRIYSDVSGTGESYSDFVELTFNVQANDGSTWWLVGSCIGNGTWDNSSNPYTSAGMVPMHPIGNGIFEYAAYFPENAAFLILGTPGVWDNSIRYGNENGGQIYLESGYGDDIRVNTAGYYKLTLNGNDHTLTWTRLSNSTVYDAISLIGEFGESQWSTDHDLNKLTTAQSVCHDWKSTITFNNNCQCKFRANHDWIVNWGAATIEGIFPYSTGQGEPNGYNINAKAGNYVVYFNDILGQYLFYKTD